MCVWRTGAYGIQERILDSLELELQVVVNYPLGELKILFFYKNMPLALSFVHPVSRKLKKIPGT